MRKKKNEEEKPEQDVILENEEEQLEDDGFDNDQMKGDEDDEAVGVQGDEENGTPDVEIAAASEEEAEAESEEDLELLKNKLKLLDEQNLRIRAEFANYKRRVERENVEFSGYIKGEVFKQLLPILDDFKIMIEQASDNENEQSVLEGAIMIYEKLYQALEKEGVTRIDALGQEFDPQIHEALMMKPIENEEEHEKIVEVFQDGFMLNEKLLRPSKVVVGKLEESEES